MNPVFFGQNQLQGAGSSYVTYSDDFNRATSDIPGVDWAEFGDADVVSNTLRFSIGDETSAAIWKTALNGLTQWAKFRVTWLNGGNYFGPYFRLADFTGGSLGYSIAFYDDGNTCGWYTSTLDVGSALISESSLTVANGDTYGITVQGTGNNTVVRVWRLPTGFPVSSSNWNGDNNPDLTFLTNPSSSREGFYVGMWGYPGASGNNLSIYDWFAGTCPD